MREGNLLWEMLPLCGRLAHQDGHTGFELGWFDSHGQTPAEARFQAFFQSRDFLRVPVTGQDNAALSLKERVESVKELFLGAFLAGKQLNVIDQQRVQGPVVLLE